MQPFQATAAVFDLDHSTLDGNAGVLFTRHLLLTGVLPPTYRRQIPKLIYRYATGKVSEAEMVEFGARCQDGLREEDVRRFASDCFSQSVRSRITKEGQQTIRSHLLKGHLVIIASGSPYPIVEATARFLGAHIAIGTRVRVKEGLLQGEILPPLSFQEGKRELVLEVLSRHGVDLSQTSLYSDAAADLPLFEIVGHPVVINPESTFERVVREKHWEVRRWKKRLGKVKGNIQDPIENFLDNLG